ncbi:MAG: AraC family transcriptional regulator [Zunongwangia sp.]|uniref:helix-turn-helix domain-containing protein n=1 Tax=Zunongwangia profunda TaxID=398743 RepID=UPI000C8AFF57|nr:AraC family transcriptional regulator [Zunongwangia profunda]MAG86160.1 AraC family transcriptional regulator [Flavobacteriaceae bacterium]MAO36496.1 AraC family transcriptional regulator [Zunongwangia sp.]|tara:strand:- start:3178 stop:4101 length:924 start_codon:yes stop_codon:yes gene_type:complete
MNKEISNEEKMRFNSLYQQIIEIACGNFMFRQEPSGRRDPIDTVAVLLNMMSEEIYNFCFEAQQQEEQPEIQFYIFLDKNLNITSYSSGTSEILKWKRDKYDRPVSEILSENSKKALIEELDSSTERAYQQFIPVDFLYENKGLYRSPCLFQRMVGVDSTCTFVITAFRFSNGNELQKKVTHTDELLNSEKKESAATKILLKQVRLYVLRNLHNELPSLKELGLIHRTNKTKLKEGFKKMYGTTIHRFHMKKRLEKGALLIRNTELPISIITQKCGFKDHSHFSKNFRIQFGKSPSQYRRENQRSIS